MSRSWLWLVVLFGALILWVMPAAANTNGMGKVLRAYGPGGPAKALQECAELFREQTGVTVAILKSSPKDLAWRVRKDGDLYFGGAEYMLDDFAANHPDVLDLQTVTELHPRQIGILVRKGNPHNIEGVDCLTRDGVDLLAVRLEEMNHFLPQRPERESNIRHLVYTGQEGVDAWLAMPHLDAWVTYRSWHVALDGASEFIPISCEQAQRHTPMAVTRRTPHRNEALKFISFLKSPEAREIFLKHGWD